MKNTINQNQVSTEASRKSLISKKALGAVLCAFLGLQVLSQPSFAQLSQNEANAILPELYVFAKPLNQQEFDFYMNAFVGLLKTECSPGKVGPQQPNEDLNSACTLLPALKYYKSLSKTMENPDLSPVEFANVTKNTHLEQLYAGTWGTSFVGEPPRGQPRDQAEFATEVMLTKVILQKSLLAYSNLVTFWSGKPNNDVKIFIIPKMIQHLEGRTLLGSLFERYRQHKCTPSQAIGKPGSNLCQIEKTRLAAIVHTLYKASSDDIARMLKAIAGLEKESVKIGVKQIAFLRPLAETLNKAGNNSESAYRMWEDLKNGKSATKTKITADVNNLTRFPIPFREDQVSAYIFSSAAMALMNLESITYQLQTLKNDAVSLIPKMIESTAMKKMLKDSKNEISEMTSGLLMYLEEQTGEGGLQ